MLLGGGHAHVHVLRALAEAPLAQVRTTLISPHASLIYSGTVPGLVAGRYAEADCAIALAPLAARARAAFEVGAATAIDAAARRVTFERADGTSGSVRFELLSIDIGGAMDRDSIPGAARHGLFVRPIETFIDALGLRLADAASAPRDLVVIGGGAGGFELALALRARLGAVPRIALVAGGPFFAQDSAALRRRARGALSARGVTMAEESCMEVAVDHVRLDGGGRIDCDLAVIATGSRAPRWLLGSGLALDRDGFIATGPSLQSVSHPSVFAAGDVAARADAPRPRNGVHAVRAGPPLARNLRRALERRSTLAYRPQRHALALLACGDGTAIAAWGAWAVEGRALGWLKDRIDRSFVAVNRVD